MRTLAISIIAILGSLFISNAQKVEFGLTAGYLYTEGKLDTSGFEIKDTENGFYLGVLAEIDINEKFRFQPEVLYGNGTDSKFLYIPLLFKYYLGERFNLQAGPQATLLLDDNAFGDPFRTFGIDLSFGLGFDITERIFIEARYAFEITDRANDNILIFGDILSPVDDARFKALGIGLGYRF
ncbi:outer membrane beta-barrel protein [Leptobacterium flavescens]|uniref:Outer membrane beta-barrel protein n=1 Tax=Leptobacterium flavescens TaxID=472055 RepID=A0A6P0UKG8_9FLAO|nr:porin family protein [Leptobacterium flavescens]NER13457.1 outer membrane beta-barrel protein [Leptobacterium flavescens]